jgi:hypothetical protein
MASAGISVGRWLCLSAQRPHRVQTRSTPHRLESTCLVSTVLTGTADERTHRQVEQMQDCFRMWCYPGIAIGGPSGSPDSGSPASQTAAVIVASCRAVAAAAVEVWQIPVDFTGADFACKARQGRWAMSSDCRELRAHSWTVRVLGCLAHYYVQELRCPALCLPCADRPIVRPRGGGGAAARAG